MLTKILSFLFAVISFITMSPLSKFDYSDKLGDENYQGLKDHYADYFDMGVAVGGWHCRNKDYSAMILKNFTSLTAENAFKQPAINPKEGVWNFDEADEIANFCRQNGLKLRGHCLVWGGLGSWMSRDDDGNLVSKEVYYQRLRDYITVMMTRYGDVVHTWDVVNEPFGYSKSTGAFKDNDLYQICGEEYITKAFEIAHEVDPSAVLVLNETKVVNNNAKQKFLLQYVEKWRSEGVPISAVGIQGHWETFKLNESPKRLQKIIDKLYKLGVDIQITEVDIAVTATDKEILEEVPKNIDLLQAKKYAQMFEVLRNNADKISSVTFWGVNDNRSYKTADGQSYHKWQLLFDKDNMPKNAFYAVCDF
ncbi:MAG: endo-1,4-beta-xylanase [Clostridia bacterium]|nr:endo-1,4-beta-xylanase [Clostridia bacterium]